MASILPTLRFIAGHPLTAKRLLSAYWRFARWQIESRWYREVEFNWIEGSKLVARNGMAGATGNIYCGLHEFADMAFVLHFLRPNDLFVDVGANIGSYTVLASAVCGAFSIAVEPDPITMRSLRRNVEANGIKDRTTLIEAALGATPGGTARFTVGNDTTNRVATAADTKTREVKVRTLDEIVDQEKPLLIKMDVEGYEVEVMAGAVKAIRNPSVMAILIETVDDMVKLQLEQAGFQRACYQPFERRLFPLSHQQHRSSSHNSLFVRDLSACRQRVETSIVRDVIGHQL